MQIPQAAFCALEAYRWAFRSVLRLHGYRFVKLMQQPLVTPTLQLHGALDAADPAAYRPGLRPLRHRPVRVAAARRASGHFPHLEAPDLVLGEILRWAKS